MIKITLQNGEIYKGKDYKEIIMQLKLEDWTDYNNPNEYKSNIKRRVKIFKGEEIEYNNDKEFIEELQRVKFIKEIEEER